MDRKCVVKAACSGGSGVEGLGKREQRRNAVRGVILVVSGHVAGGHGPARHQRKTERRFDESAPSAAHDGPVVAPGTPGEAEARSQIRAIGEAKRLGNARLRRGEDGRGRDTAPEILRRIAARLRVGDHYGAVDRRRAVAAGARPIGQERGRIRVRLVDGRVQLVAQAQVERQVLRQLPVVLRKHRPGITQAIHRRIVGGAHFGVVGIAEQESGVRIADGLAHVGAAVEDVPAGAVVAVDVVVVIGEAHEVRAKFEGMRVAGPRHVVQELHDFAALHPRIACPGGHEAVDEHLRGLGPLRVGLGNDRGESRFGQQTGGRVALCLRCVLSIEAAAKLVQQTLVEDVIVREGQAFVDLGRVIAALQRAAGLGAIRVQAGRRWRGDHLAILVGEAREDRLARGERVVQANIALVGGDRRGKVDLVIIRVGVGRAVIRLREQVLDCGGGDRAWRQLRWIERRAIGHCNRADALAGEITGQIAIAHGHRGHAEQHGRFARQAQAFVADEEKCFVVPVQKMRDGQRTAQRAAEVVHDDPRFGKRKGIVRVENGVFIVLEEAAVEVHGARLGDGGNVGNPGKLRAVVRFRDANLLDGVEGGEHLVHRARVFHAYRGDAVDGHAEQRGRGAHYRQVAAIVGLHARLRGQSGDGAGRSCGTRVNGHGKIHQFVAQLGLGQVGDVGGDHRVRVVPHFDGFALRARLERGVDAPCFARGKRDLRQRLCGEARRGDGELVDAYVDVPECIVAAFVGHGHQHGLGPCVFERNPRALDDGACGVAHDAQDGAECGLRRNRAGGGCREPTAEEKQPEGELPRGPHKAAEFFHPLPFRANYEKTIASTAF